MKITELQLQNFKFFTGSDNTLKLPKGENVLIWGENGSGKSSIYWAIYTLLQCSYKNEQGINDYFIPDDEKNLVNIHKPDEERAFVKMTTDNGNIYNIELNDYSVIDNIDLQLSAVSSDFLDYNVLASFMRAYHSDDLFLFDTFKEDIFRYLPFKAVAPFSFQFFDKAWEELNKPLERTGKKNLFPNKNSNAVIKKNNLKREFNKQLKTLLGLATTRANKILNDSKYFNLPIEIELAYNDYNFELLDNNTDVRYTKPEIQLKVRKYYDKEDAVHKPHSFLNEAKKTAIGLAIRLGILQSRLLEDKLNLLALDDLLVSLDMSNREVVLNLLFSEYQEKYQILLFTHDKQFFNIAKHKIENRPEKANWLFWEFYVNEKDPKIPKPRLFETKTQLAIAFNHLQENDYPAAANYLRKQCEHLIETNLPQYCYRDINKDKSHKNYPLDGMLTNAALFLNRINQPATIAKINEVKQYVEMLLNPLSHTERGVDRHKGEIKAVIKLLDDLEIELAKLKFSKIPILPLNTDLFLTLVKDANNTFKIQLKLREDLFVYEDAGEIKLSKCLTDSIAYWHYETGQPEKTGDFKMHSNKEIATSYNDITTFETIAIPVIPNWETLFSKADGARLNTLMIIQ